MDELETKQNLWTQTLKSKGHEPKEKNGELDYFAYKEKSCNGPGCSKCMTFWCWHCDGIDEIKECKPGDTWSYHWKPVDIEECTK